MMDFTNAVFRKCGIGATNIRSNHDYPEALSEFHLAEGDIYENDNLRMENIQGEVVVKELQCNYAGHDGRSFVLPVSQLSEGAVRLLNVCALLYKAIYADCVVFADEIECHINPATAKNLVSLFAESDSKGQLVYNTNNLLLVNQQEFNRTDEV